MYGPSQRARPGWARIAITGFVLASCLRAWTGPSDLLTRAEAQLPNPAEQRYRVIAEAKRTNELLKEIKQILDTKVLNVRIAGADNKAGPPVAPPRGGR